MRSTFSGLNTMVKGIYSNQISQETVGHNISNAGTEGYSRQRVNLAATHAQEQSSIYGTVQIGTGVDSKALTRARDIYADRQYWSENPTMTYYEARAKEYDKLETIFDDSMDQGIAEALAKFYKSWQTLSTSASDSSARISALEQGKNFADKMHTVTSQLQDQIEANYADIRLNVGKVNEMLEQVVQLNKSICGVEVTGAMANDLRDQRDLLVDKISDFVNVDVHEKDDGMYTLVSNGVSLVNGISRLTLEMSEPSENEEYGVIDYSILIKESNIEYQPLNGILRAELDAVAEDKSYIDKMADIAAFMLSDFNYQHQQGHGVDAASTAGVNFFGQRDTQYVWNATTRSLEATQYTQTLDMIGYNYTVAQNPNYDVTDPNYNYVQATLNTAAGTVVTPPGTYTMTKVGILATLSLNTQLTAPNGHLLIAASGYGFEADSSGNPVVPNNILPNGSGDGANAVAISTLFNLDMSKDPRYVAGSTGNDNLRAIGTISLDSYYIKTMTALGTNAETMDTRIKTQKDIMTQVTEWRQSTAGVNWNEELSNMIMFQQGFSSCSRCLTTMDEMLDRLINSTGVVGR